MPSLRFYAARHLKVEAAKDDIKVSLRIVGNQLMYQFGRNRRFSTFESALAYVKYLQSLIVYTPYDPTKDGQ